MLRAMANRQFGRLARGQGGRKIVQTGGQSGRGCRLRGDGLPMSAEGGLVHAWVVAHTHTCQKDSSIANELCMYVCVCVLEQTGTALVVVRVGAMRRRPG